MTEIEMRALCHEVAEKFQIDGYLFEAICSVESGFSNSAIRYEAGYKWTWYPRELASRQGITEITEETLQKISYGICQVMGAVAREFGFTAPLTSLMDPELCLIYGAKLLRRYYVKYGELNESDIIASYNAGSPIKTPGGMYQNQAYVNKVTTVLRALRKPV